MKEIRGVLLCGGEGTRLRPLTNAVNKHLIRVGNKAMVEYPLWKMIQAGIKNIHVVTGGENYQGVVKYLGSGSAWGVNITYSIQDRAGGIAEALGMAEASIGNHRMLVILGDNVFDAYIGGFVKEFQAIEAPRAALFAYPVDHPERFGVIKYAEPRGMLDKIEDVIEKPAKAPSNDVLVGIYMYTPDVFDIIKTLKPSGRGELEITDVNRFYIKEDRATVIKLTGNWTDCGTFESLAKAEEHVKRGGFNDKA